MAAIQRATGLREPGTAGMASRVDLVWSLALCVLLGTPVLLMIKAVSDRVDDLKPLGQLMGR